MLCFIKIWRNDGMEIYANQCIIYCTRFDRKSNSVFDFV